LIQSKISDNDFFRQRLRHGNSKIAENVERNCFKGAREGKFKLVFVGRYSRFFLFTYVVMYNFALYKINR